MEETLQPYEILATDAIGNPTFIDFISTKVKSDDKSVYEFLKTVYGFDENTTFVEEPNSSNLTNGVYTKVLNQYYKGIQADFGQVVITHKNNLLRSISGSVNLINIFSIIPSISEKEALEFALKQINAVQYAWENEGFEQILRNDEKNPKATHYPAGQVVVIDRNILDKKLKPCIRLAYKFEVYSLFPLSRKYYYIDTETKEIISENSLIAHANGSGTTKYSEFQSFQTQSHNGSFRLHDYTRGNGIETYDMNMNADLSTAIDFTDSDNNWSAIEHDNAEYDDAALDAHWGIGVAHDYFYNTFSRNGYDDAGGLIKNYVHVDLVTRNGFANNRNAVWISGSILYGDGTTGLGKPYTTLDVVGHEFGHGVTFKDVNNMPYSPLGEGASLHEGLADIWGAMIEHSSNLKKETYVHGDELVGETQYAMRCHYDPTITNQPTTYEAGVWEYPNGLDMNHVHHNSVILPHWFYILAEGKAGTNDLGNFYDIQGIGKEKAARIVYLAQKRFSYTTNFSLARLETIKAANDIFGAGSIEARTVCKAWYAVGVGGNGCSTRIVSGGGFGDGNDPTNQPSEVDVICDRGNKTYSLLFVNSTSTVVWEVSSNLEKMNETTLSLTVRGRLNGTLANTLGHAYVIATVDGVPYRQDIWIGEPQVEMRYEQTIPYQVFVHIEGANGTDITKQGITNIDWQLVNPTGSCTPTLDIYNPNVFLALVQANCNNWAAQMQVGVTNECGTIPLTRNITSDGYLGGGGSGVYPCYDIIDYYGIPFIVPVPCVFGNILDPFGRNQNQIQQFTIHNYMGVPYGTYENTNVLPIKIPFGLYLIKGIDKEGNLFTLKYLKK